MTDAECGFPYQGAKEAYILDFADTCKALKVIETLWNDLPFPKSKEKVAIESSHRKDRSRSRGGFGICAYSPDLSG